MKKTKYTSMQFLRLSKTTEFIKKRISGELENPKPVATK